MIERIILNNFKCFDHMDIELSNLNVFAGINSMGKSTAIQSLLLLRQAFELNSISTGIPLNGSYVQIGTGKDLLFKDSKTDEICIKLVTDLESLNFSYKYNKESDFLKLNSSPNISGENLKSINLFKPTFAYVSSDRIGPQRFYTSSYHDVMDNNQVGINGEFFAAFLAKRKDEKIKNNNILHKNCKTSFLIDQANAWLSEISPDMEINANEDSTTGIVTLTYTSNKVSPKNVGFGLSYLAPIIIALLKAKENDLVIIENPEAHIHPKGQRILGELIAKAASGGVQVLLETHSDHILNGIRLSVKKNIISREKTRLNFFYRKKIEDTNLLVPYKYQKMSPQILDNGELSDWPEDFFDEWDKALMELL